MKGCRLRKIDRVLSGLINCPAHHFLKVRRKGTHLELETEFLRLLQRDEEEDGEVEENDKEEDVEAGEEVKDEDEEEE